MQVQIGVAKNKLLTPEQVRVKGSGFSDPVIVGDVYALYERQLQS